MRLRRFILAVLGTPLVMLWACGGTDVEDKTEREFSVDHTRPDQVVEAIFAVARGADPQVLGDLCDPEGPVDLDVRRICDYAEGFDPEGEFPMFFAEGRIAGPYHVMGDRAWVPFYFGPTGEKRDTMQLVKRAGKWYLGQFWK